MTKDPKVELGKMNLLEGKTNMGWVVLLEGRQWDKTELGDASAALKDKQPFKSSCCEEKLATETDSFLLGMVGGR